MKIPWLVYAILLLPCTSSFLTQSDLKKLSSAISSHFVEFFENATKTSELENEFNRLHKEKYFEIKEKNFSEISRNFSESLYDLLESNKQSLVNIKNQIQNSHKSYKYNQSITRFDYANERDVSPSKVQLEPTFNPTYKVNITQSHVQIPMNIYKYDTQILNDVKWTEDINKVFRDNFERTPSLLWQYFTTKTGVMRTYPGRRDDTPANFYDARRRPWYTEAINSPKDVVIAVDLSGSLIGTPYKIAALTIKSLIKTFQQNDFFNVIYSINKKISFIEPCMKTLIQATNQNKEMINQKIDRIDEPRGEQNNSGLLEEAFLLFNRSLQSDMTSSGCTKTLMLISDGIESDTEYSKIIDRYQNELDVVIFTFFIGFGTCKEQMQELAMENGGAMYDFPTLGSVWNGVLEHQTVLSEPLAAANYSNNITFTPLYLDFFEDDQIGLGMIISMAIGVFSRLEKRELLGAAGIDIRITQLEQIYPKHTLGVFGRAFAINNNGLFLIHPNFRDPAPFIFELPTLYLEDIEHTINKSSAEKLKLKMVERETGCFKTQVSFLFPPLLHTRLKILNTTYCFHPIDETPFTSAVSIPEEHKYYIEITNTSLEQLGIDGLNNSKGIIKEIADWFFCNITAAEQTYNPASKKYYPKAYELYDFLKRNRSEIYEKCELNKLNKLLFTSAVISNHTKFWSSDVLKDLNISSLFIFTDSGFILILKENATEIPNRDIFSKQQYMHSISNIVQEEIVKLTFTVPTNSAKNKFDRTSENWNRKISIARPIIISPDRIPFGVMGFNYSTDQLNSYLKSIALNISFDNTTCNPDVALCDKVNISWPIFTCEDIDVFSCYFIDENAFVVSSNQEGSDVGMFFGLISGMLMNEFLNSSLYKVSTFNDTQAICVEITSTTSSSNASILKTWLYNLSTSFMYLASNFITIMSFWCKLAFSEEDISMKDDLERANVSCTKTVSVYTQSRKNISQTGEILCRKNCIQEYVIRSVEKTNLNLVIIKKNCDLNCDGRMISNEPVKINSSNFCNRKILHRKKLSVCNRKRSKHSKSVAAVNKSHSCYAIFIALLVIYARGRLLS